MTSWRQAWNVSKIYKES